MTLGSGRRPGPAPGAPTRHPVGVTLVELSITVAVLMILLGLAVNLGNRVRGDATDALARERLRLLTALMDQYVAGHGGAVPDVPPLLPDVGPPGTEATAQAAARRNNAAVLAAVASVADPVARSAVARLFDAPGFGTPAGHPPAELDDPWGSPIVYLPRQNPQIGMARDDRPFFVSAGPDRKFLTRQDNLYSYEVAGGP